MVLLKEKNWSPDHYSYFRHRVQKHDIRDFKIMVGIDGSKESVKAADYAYAIAIAERHNE
jgi:hypothetical protein